VNNAVTSELYEVILLWLWVSSFLHSLIVQLHSKLLATFRDNLQTATGTQGSYSCTHDPPYCSRDKHLARPDKNKKKWKETVFLPCLVCLLRNKSVNSITESRGLNTMK